MTCSKQEVRQSRAPEGELLLLPDQMLEREQEENLSRSEEDSHSLTHSLLTVVLTIIQPRSVSHQRSRTQVLTQQRPISPQRSSSLPRDRIGVLASQ